MQLPKFIFYFLFWYKREPKTQQLPKFIWSGSSILDNLDKIKSEKMFTLEFLVVFIIAG